MTSVLPRPEPSERLHTGSDRLRQDYTASTFQVLQNAQEQIDATRQLLKAMQTRLWPLAPEGRPRRSHPSRG